MEHLSEIAAKLRQAGIPVVCREKLSAHTSFQVGGPAAMFCEPQNKKQLIEVLQLCREKKVRYYLLGKGTNVLFADEGFDGVVIHIGTGFGHIECHNRMVTACAGAPLAKVCIAAVNEGLSGLEFAYGIPGSVGGAVYMNAGAYGGEIKDVLSSVTFLDENGIERTLPAEKLELGYRTSAFEHNDWCILAATFRLKEEENGLIRERMSDYAHRRIEKQPLDMPSAGSTFKRPQGAYAGALIDQCGLRGYRIGGAQVSEKHCGFIVNAGGATCEDILCLADTVCEIVSETTGFQLEKEVRVVR